MQGSVTRVSGPDYSGQQRVISPTSRRWDACPSFLFFSAELTRWWFQRASTFKTALVNIGGSRDGSDQTQLASARRTPFNWSNITQWWAGGDDGGLFYTSDSSVFHELSGRVFPPVRTFVCLLCVSITSSVSDHSLHVIAPLSAGKKNPSGFFLSFRQPHNSRIVASFH